MKLVNLADYEAMARTKLTETAWDFYAGGAEDERTVADNCQAFGRLKLRPRVLVDVRTRTLATEVLGQPLALPVMHEVAAATPGPLWFQLYTFGTREAIARLVHTAEQAGCRALVVTVTAFYEPRLERHLRRPLLLLAMCSATRRALRSG